MDVVTASLKRMEVSVLFLVLCGLAFLIGVLLNGYIRFIVGCRVERTVSATWFMNQAMADFIFIIFLPLKFISIFTQGLDWAQRLSGTITSLHLFTSAFFLMALSIDRCILVACPVWARNHYTPRLAYFVILGMWALSLGFSLRYNDLWESLLLPKKARAHFQLDNERLKAAVVIQFLVGFLIPLALILILTFYIVLTAKMRRNRLIQSTKPLKILLALVPTFFICWLPYHIFSFLLISPTYPQDLWMRESTCASALTYFSSCLNPIFYLNMDDEYLKYRQRVHNPQTSYNLRPESSE